MLAAVALAVARNAAQRAATFVIAFGTWAITFYVFLKVLLGWPASLFTWDILFLIQVSWAGPVLAPVLVSAFTRIRQSLRFVVQVRANARRAAFVALSTLFEGRLYWPRSMHSGRSTRRQGSNGSACCNDLSQGRIFCDSRIREHLSSLPFSR